MLGHRKEWLAAMVRSSPSRAEHDAQVPGRNPGADVLVELRDVSVRYPPAHSLPFRSAEEGVLAVDGVTFEIRRGETLGVLGATGSGKSTLAHLIMGMIRPTSGTVSIAGQDPSLLRGRNLLRQRRLVQVVLQDPFSSLDPRMRVDDIVSEPLTLGYPWRKRAQVKERVAELLRLVGLSADKANLYPHQFSGGQRQRIAVARALASGPEILILDEPTSALDVSVRAQILNLLKSLQAQLGVTYFVISHDLVTVAYLSTTVAVMDSGRIVETGPTQSVFEAPRNAYTRELLASAPVLRPAVGSNAREHRLPLDEIAANPRRLAGEGIPD